MGNRLTGTDSNGDRYDGILVIIRSTSGAGAVGATGTIIGEFQMTGRGRKANVTIEGSFLAEYVVRERMSVQEQLVRQRLGQQFNSGSGSTAVLLNRTITGSWFEHDPLGNIIKSGDVLGVADIQRGSQQAPADNNNFSNIVVSI